MKMSGLCWMDVVLAFILSVGNSLAVLDPKKLVKIIEGIRSEYYIEGQFSLAVNIPVDQDLDKLEELFEKDPFASVIEKISKDEVYQGTNVVAAKFKKFVTFTDHAEARVLDEIKPLADSSKGHFLVFYSYLSPCGAKCTNTDNKNNILDKINRVISKWKDYAFVFSKIFDRTKDGTLITKTEIVEALKQLGESKIGHNNIFRCYKPMTNGFQCIKCTSNGKLLDQCVNNERYMFLRNNRECGRVVEL